MGKKKRVICSALGCKKAAIYDDMMETAPGIFTETKVCKRHLGQLVGNATLHGKYPIYKNLKPYSVSMESD